MRRGRWRRGRRMHRGMAHIVGADAVRGERLHDVGEARMGRGIEQEQVVHAGSAPLLIATQRVRCDEHAADHGSAVAHGISEEQHRARLFIRGRPTPRFFILLQQAERAAYDSDLRMLVQEGHLPRQTLVVHQVIRIQHGDVLPKGRIEAPIRGCRPARVARVPEEPDPWIPDGAHALRALIGAAIVHYQHLEIREGVGQRTAQGVLDKGSFVVQRDEYGYARHSRNAGKLPDPGRRA